MKVGFVMYTFNEFLKLLPDCDIFPTADTKPLSVSYQTQQPNNFIPPNLSINNELADQEPANTSVIIISAPGAVGKSTLGKAIAFNNNALFWDLSVAGEVGSASLDGMLLNTIGNQHIGEFNEYLAEGFQFLVIDALDEGRIKVTENSFRQLLQNISTLSQNSSSPRFVLLGRTRIAEEAWLVFNDMEVDASILSIDPFNRDQANQYIEDRVGLDKRTIPFNECRDLIFEQLDASVSESSVGDSAVNFLHYPPVLDVIATLLNAESNPQRLKNNLVDEENNFPANRITRLRNIIESILRREQDKLRRNIEDVSGEESYSSEQIDWHSLYTIEEQRVRLLGNALNISVSDTAKNLPDPLKTRYEDSVEAFLPEHPFLQGTGKFANTVFRSYLYSNALRGNCGDEMKKRVTQELLNREHLPSRLLADFYLTTNESNDEILPEIHPDHIGILYDSLLSSESAQSYVRLNIDGSEPGDSDLQDIETVEGEFEFLQDNPARDTQIPSISFSIEIASNSVISFTRGLRDAFITVPCIVELGNNTPEFQIGPAVQINANTIRINSESLIIGAKTRLRPQEEDANPVILESLTCESSLVNRRPTIYETSKLLVVWPEAERHPWTDFRAERTQENFGDDQALPDVYRRFKRIATTFRSHSRGALARTKQKIGHRRILQGALGEALLAQLEEDRILTLGDGGSRYFWNAEEADSHLGVTWQDLRQWAMPETLREYLSKFIREHPELF